jgi:ATP-binding cassette subfamily B protein
MAVSCLLVVTSSASSLAAGFFTGRYTDYLMTEQKFRPYPLFYMLLAAIGISIAAQALSRYHWGRFYQQIAFMLREKTVKKINSVDYTWIEAHPAGDLTVRLNDDLNQLLNFYTQIRTQAASFFIGFLAFAGIWHLNFFLALGYVVFPSLMQFVIYASSGRLEPQFKKRQELFGAAAGCSQDFLNSATDIKAMNAAKIFIRRYAARIAAYIGHVIRLDRASAGNDTILEALGFFQSILILALGGLLVFRENISIGELLTAQLLSVHIGSAVRGLNFFQLRMNLASALRVLELWEADDVVTGAHIHKNDDNAVRLGRVGFSYPQRPGAEVLHDINFAVKRGQKAALVGPSGGGKSTIVKLIAGFYRPDRGDISSFQTGGHAYSMIEQDTFLFAGSFFDNIACANKNFPPEGGGTEGGEKADLAEEVIRAAKRADIHDYIMSTEHGYDSNCAAHNLSGGQRQRLSLARCLCRDAGIVLLDEPTSALDRETEASVMDSLNEALKGKTVIMVTHNIGLVKDFDIIYLVENGRIAGYGTHNELLQNGLYRSLLGEASHE